MAKPRAALPESFGITYFASSINWAFRRASSSYSTASRNANSPFLTALVLKTRWQSPMRKLCGTASLFHCNLS